MSDITKVSDDKHQDFGRCVFAMHGPDIGLGQRGLGFCTVVQFGVILFLIEFYNCPLPDHKVTTVFGIYQSTTTSCQPNKFKYPGNWLETKLIQ